MNFRNRSALCPHVIGIMIFLFMTTACAITPPQRSAITEFGEATALFAQLATSELHQMRDSVVAMNVSRLALEGTADNPDLTNLDEQFDPDVVELFLFMFRERKVIDNVFRSSSDVEDLGTRHKQLVGDATGIVSEDLTGYAASISNKLTTRN